jgi:hypothetical protein
MRQQCFCGAENRKVQNLCGIDNETLSAKSRVTFCDFVRRVLDQDQFKVNQGTGRKPIIFVSWSVRQLAARVKISFPNAGLDSYRERTPPIP